MTQFLRLITFFVANISMKLIPPASSGARYQSDPNWSPAKRAKQLIKTMEGKIKIKPEWQFHGFVTEISLIYQYLMSAAPRERERIKSSAQAAETLLSFVIKLSFSLK